MHIDAVQVRPTHFIMTSSQFVTFANNSVDGTQVTAYEFFNIYFDTPGLKPVPIPIGPGASPTTLTGNTYVALAWPLRPPGGPIDYPGGPDIYFWRSYTPPATTFPTNAEVVLEGGISIPTNSNVDTLLNGTFRAY